MGHGKTMKTANFDFTLTEDRIARHPARPRDSARLLVVGQGSPSGLQDRVIRDLPEILRPGDLMVFNDTKVIPAQLEGRKGEARIEVTLIRRDERDARLWQALARPGKKLREGDEIRFHSLDESHPHPNPPPNRGRGQGAESSPSPDSGEGWGGGESGLTAAVLGKHDSGEITLRFDCAESAMMAMLQELGSMPLPPYIRKLRPTSAEDAADYQTVYAAREGAVASPTAGLHFTPELLAALDRRGVARAHVTLHVGAGTFLPVKADDLADHKMHAEWGEITAATADAFNRARAEGRRIVAAGTTSLRLLESALDAEGKLQPFSAETAIFIHPGKAVRSADLLLTNFHLPKSTLFMLVCAFAGTERMRAAYAHAIEDNYRFFSYGDACLLERAA
jgi:S-adenosylmethionine:tRNA ribosyltransferase-isomerase